LRNIESSKFIFKNSILILLTENIELDFNSRTVLYTDIIQLLLRLSQILQFSVDIDKSLLLIEQNIKNILNIDINSAIS